MWKRTSLRTRLLLPLAAMFTTALFVGVIALRLFAGDQLIDESRSPNRAARQVADALNATLQVSPNPSHLLDAFGKSLGNSEAIQFRLNGILPSAEHKDQREIDKRVPHWFIDLIDLPDVSASYPIMMAGIHVADIVFSPDISAEIYEKWIGFLAITFSSIALMVLTGIIAYFVVGATLQPLQELGHGLTRMREGDYRNPIRISGPPELRKSSVEANELAVTLSRLSDDNRELLRRVVSLQDDERRDLARELHDELGPLLFGIRVSTITLLQAADQESVSSAEQVLQSVEALQQANRRILDRLRPLYIQELGLTRSIETLIRNAQAQAPKLKLSLQLDHSLKSVDGVLSQTVYRVIQEGVTNALRHANASTVIIKVALDSEQLAVEISDDGVGLSESNVLGRGLLGMHERARALGGTLQLLRENGLTVVRCRLPNDNSRSASVPGS